jgi:uncharacterized protein
MPKVKTRLAYAIRHSTTHGCGAFATRTIRKGSKIVEYRGRRSSYEEACERPDSDVTDPFHTLLFEVSDGSVIDAGIHGSAAKWINHSCAPNCEPIEHEGLRVFIHAKRTIHAGEELTYDYRLVFHGRLSRRARNAMACRCGARRCRGTMLDHRGAKNKL